VADDDAGIDRASGLMVVISIACIAIMLATIRNVPKDGEVDSTSATGTFRQHQPTNPTVATSAPTVVAS
jgi:hypothetical protein